VDLHRAPIERHIRLPLSLFHFDLWKLCITSATQFAYMRTLVLHFVFECSLMREYDELLDNYPCQLWSRSSDKFAAQHSIVFIDSFHSVKHFSNFMNPQHLLSSSLPRLIDLGLQQCTALLF
jgi:hypothetical protein